MFSRNKSRSSGKSIKTKQKPPAPSILGKDLRINGDLKTDGDIQLDGVVNGDIQTNLLTVGVDAVVNGAITGDTVRIAGSVNGTITGRIVELSKSAKVIGDIVHQSLAIEAGAHIEGMCRHVEPEQQHRIESSLSRPSLVIEEPAAS